MACPLPVEADSEVLVLSSKASIGLVIVAKCNTVRDLFFLEMLQEGSADSIEIKGCNTRGKAADPDSTALEVKNFGAWKTAKRLSYRLLQRQVA